MKITYKDNRSELTIDMELNLNFEEFHKEIPKIVQTMIHSLYPQISIDTKDSKYYIKDDNDKLIAEGEIRDKVEL